MDSIEIRPEQDYVTEWLMQDDPVLHDLSEVGLLKTIEDNGRVVAILGACPEWDGRATLWALISKQATYGITPIAKELLDGLPFFRVEATVDVGFKQGIKWLTHMGFEIEGYLRKYRPDGKDMIMMAKVD
jgi:hypothetical protein